MIDQILAYAGGSAINVLNPEALGKKSRSMPGEGREPGDGTYQPDLPTEE